jgi:hypothetical protein
MFSKIENKKQLKIEALNCNKLLRVIEITQRRRRNSAQRTHNVKGRKSNFVAPNAGEACLCVLPSSIFLVFFALNFFASFALKLE